MLRMDLTIIVARTLLGFVDHHVEARLAIVDSLKYHVLPHPLRHCLHAWQVIEPLEISLPPEAGDDQVGLACGQTGMPKDGEYLGAQVGRALLIDIPKVEDVAIPLELRICKIPAAAFRHRPNVIAMFEIAVLIVIVRIARQLHLLSTLGVLVVVVPFDVLTALESVAD